MKKLFVIALAAMTMTACGNKNQNSEESNEATELMEQIQASGAEVDAETQALIDKAKAGQITEEENLTLIQKLKNIGASVVAGEKSSEEGASEAAEEVKDAAVEEAKDAAAPVVEKAEEVKQKADNVKAAANGLKDAVNALKK